MSDDIVERLRRQIKAVRETTYPPECAPEIDLDDTEDACREIERLRAELSTAYEAQGEMAKREDEVAAAIGAEYLLDPPDGGDVSLAEGVGRIKAERDALRALLREAFDRLVEARRELEVYCEEIEGEDYNSPRLNETMSNIDAALKGDDRE